MVALWPRRAQQECLFDLGERKAWTEVERQAALAAAANWIRREVCLPTMRRNLAISDDVASDARCVKHVRALGAKIAPGNEVPGVAHWAAGLARSLGMAPKTLANTISTGLEAHRCDHRWIRAIGRIVEGRGDAHAWAYHRRTPEAVGRALRRLVEPARLDAGDAVLVLSLLALWQRRRPTEQAKGNRLESSTRRAAPKPIARLCGTLVQPAQVGALLELATHLPSLAGQTLASLALEAALTEAHLAPHRTRAAVARDDSTSGEPWLGAVEAAVSDSGNLLPADERDVLRFRIDRMRAWRDGRPQSAVSESLVRNPHVAASLALERNKSATTATALPFHFTTPGILMLIPQLRARGLVGLP